MSQLEVTKLTNNVVRGGKLVEDTAYIVTKDGALIGRKQHATEEAAKEELGTLKFYAAGLEFVQATSPELADKAQVGKAKVVASYLAWVDAGKPVKEAELEESEEVEADFEEEDEEDNF